MSIMEVILEAFDPESHSLRLRDWLQRPHVARWWGNPQVALEGALRHSRETCAVIAADGIPVGYMCWQTPGQDELEAAGLADLPKSLVDIDILVGEPQLIGQGIGPRALDLLLTRLGRDPAVSFAGVGTSVSNKRAIRAFEKAGFSLFRDFRDPEFGSCRYLIKEVREAV